MITSVTKYSEIADFVIRQSDGFFGEMDRIAVMETLKAFDAVGQLIVARKNDKVSCVIYFDWLSDNTIEVKEVIIHKAHRSLRYLKSVILKGLLIYSNIKFIKFGRRKYSDRTRTYSVEQFFKGEL